MMNTPTHSRTRDSRLAWLFAGAMLLIDAHLAAAFPETGFDGLELFDKVSHMCHAGSGLGGLLAS